MVALNVSDVASIGALLVAVLSLALSVWAFRRQNKYDKTAERLNNLLIDKESEETATKSKADLGVNFVNLGKSDKLKVFNRGPATARNVEIEIVEGSDLFIQSDIDEKFPVQIFEKHQTVSLIVCRTMGTPSKSTIKLSWDDESGLRNEKKLTPTF